MLLVQGPASHPSASRLHEAFTGSVRAGARWVGLGLVRTEEGGEEEEVILGVSDKGTIHAVRHAERMGGGDWW